MLRRLCAWICGQHVEWVSLPECWKRLAAAEVIRLERKEGE